MHLKVLVAIFLCLLPVAYLDCGDLPESYRIADGYEVTIVANDI